MSRTGLNGQFRPPTATLLRVIFALVGLAALVLGYLGFATYLRADHQFANDPLDLLYYDLQLFVLGANPLQNGSPGYPTALQIARFAAPAVTIFAFVEAGRLLLATEVRRLRARRRRGHTVVCGESAVARTLAGTLQAAGHRVVAVRHAPGGVERRARRMLVVAGDPTDPDVLREAGAGRAAVLYACTGDSAANASIALAAGQVARGRRRPLAVYAHVSDPELCVALQARRLGRAQPSGLRVDFFNVDDLAARLLFAREPLGCVERPPRILVAGASGFGRAVVVAAARRWRLTGHDTPMPVDLVDEDASRAVIDLGERYPFLGGTCRMTPHDAPLAELLADGRLGPPDRAYICYDDEEAGLKLALTAQALWHRGTRSVVVRLDKLAGFAEAFHGRNGDRLLDEVSGKLHLYRLVDAACDPVIINEDLVERLAQVIHEHYVLNLTHPEGARAPASSAVAWARLSDEFKRANRAQADDIGAKLRAVGCVLSPRCGGDGAATFTEAEVELLAELEHLRWVTERTGGGWLFGKRDDRARRHPHLSGWATLDEDAREKNRAAIRELPRILADAGFQIIRIDREPHNEAVADPRDNRRGTRAAQG